MKVDSSSTLLEEYGSSSDSESPDSDPGPSEEPKTVSASELYKPNKQNGVTPKKEEESRRKKAQKLTQQKEWLNFCRSKPDPTKDREKERLLVRTATKGVVQLFNAVSERHRAIEENLKRAGPSEFKRDAVLGKMKTEKFIEKLSQPPTKKSKSWKVLDNDFVPENEEEPAENGDISDSD